MGCYIWYSTLPEWAAAPPSPLLDVPNVTAHPSMASVPITELLYDGPLLCGCNVAIQGLKLAEYMIALHQQSTNIKNLLSRIFTFFSHSKATWCFVSLNILPSHSKLFEMTPLDRACVSIPV